MRWRIDEMPERTLSPNPATRDSYVGRIGYVVPAESGLETTTASAPDSELTLIRPTPLLSV